MRTLSSVSLLLLLLGACADAPDPGPAGLAALGSYAHTLDAVELVELATATDGLATPRDLEFDPSEPNALYVVNRNTSIALIRDPGLPTQSGRQYAGPGSSHFLARPAGIAFGQTGTFATAPEEDEVTQPSTPADFMGPSLWTTDTTVFDAGWATHLDMLHNSPNSAGIAWERDNVYWIFDGSHNSLTRYNFMSDHGPGGADHSDGIVSRFVEGQVSYAPGVPSHMEFDAGLLFVSDTGNNRIAVLDPNEATVAGAIGPYYDGTDQHSMNGGTLTTLVDGTSIDGMQRPSGLVIDGDILYVSDNETSTIFGFDRDSGELLDWLDVSPQVAPGGLMGLALDSEGRLLLVDALTDRVLRLAPAPIVAP